MAYVERFFRDEPDGVLDLTTLRQALQIENRSNFNRTIRQSEEFMATLEELGVGEVSIGASRHRNAIRRQGSGFDPFPDDGEDWDF